MVNLKSALLAAVYAFSFTAAQGTDSIGSVTCGSKTYTKQQIDEATAEGCRLFASNQQVGDRNYPHRFSNFEKLVFATSGPYQEFPLVSNGKYTGGSPGADRIVFNPNHQGSCVYVGAMTHTGATNNGFLTCSEKSAGRPGGSSSPSSSSSSSTSAPTSSSTATPDSGSGRMVALGGQGLAVGLMIWAFML